MLIVYATTKLTSSIVFSKLPFAPHFTDTKKSWDIFNFFPFHLNKGWLLMEKRKKSKWIKRKSSLRQPSVFPSELMKFFENDICIDASSFSVLKS